MLLFCLPYAGGSETIYYKWKKYLNPDIKLYPVELKGRGRRFNESFYESIEDTIDDIFNGIKDKICNNDYAIYGHSMGSLLSYELYYKINEMGIKKPKHIFFSGYEAPDTIINEKIHTLSNEDFINKIIELGGTPKELLNNKDFSKILLPIIRNDYKVLESYNYKERINKIECNISALNGNLDSIDLKDILAWNRHTSGSFKLYNFEGNHFFINNNAERIVNVINNILIK